MTTYTDIQIISTTRHLAETGEARLIRTNARIRTMELASVIGVAPTTLTRWETGYRVPSAADTLKWGAALRDLSMVRGDSYDE
jgi:DNA-binding transcriptional regulator YiaG